MSAVILKTFAVERITQHFKFKTREKKLKYFFQKLKENAFFSLLNRFLKTLKKISYKFEKCSLGKIRDKTELSEKKFKNCFQKLDPCQNKGFLMFRNKGFLQRPFFLAKYIPFSYWELFFSPSIFPIWFFTEYLLYEHAFTVLHCVFIRNSVNQCA